MNKDKREQLQKIKSFDSLVKFLKEELGWPIESNDFEDLVYDYTPEELGIDPQNSAKINYIKRLRPLVPNQPWGIFFVSFEPKRLPIIPLRRILNELVVKKRVSRDRQAWEIDDLLFISTYGETDHRQISFANFSKEGQEKLPTLKILGWDNQDTNLHLDATFESLHQNLFWPEDDGVDSEKWRESWRRAFTIEYREQITTSKAMALRLAELASVIRDRIRSAISIETQSGPLRMIKKAFLSTLIHDLSDDDFANMYAQTISYGLLTARITQKNKLNNNLTQSIPVTNPFLKELLETFLIDGQNGHSVHGINQDFDELGVNEVIQTLENSNMEAVVRDFRDRNPQEDPVIHFYELFLKEYDAKTRFDRGVFYTPGPVVSYIVRSVDDMLREQFGLNDGLADTTTWAEISKRIDGLKIPEGTNQDQAFVQILDPAAGTGTFLVEAIDVIHKTLVDKWKIEGYSQNEIITLWNEYVPKHLLPRLHGYELLMAPYAIAHLNIGIKLLETGYQFGKNERARVYLTNFLEPASDNQFLLDFMPAFAHEVEAVNEIKKNQRFTVVIGNPPYGKSQNHNNYINKLMMDYKKPVQDEKNLQPLDDDYIKFIRLSHHILAKSPAACMGIITNSTYIDGRIHRGIRKSIGTDFPLIKILNLHGSQRRSTLQNISSEDKNVFNIQQAVAVGFFCRGPINNPRVYYRDLTGPLDYKYDALMQGLANHNTQWIQLNPSSNYLCLWIEQKGQSYDDEFLKFTPLDEFFIYSNISGTSGADELLVSFDKDEVIPKLKSFTSNKQPGKLTEVMRKLIANTSMSKFSNSAVIPYAYRPFDIRWTYYDPKIWSRARPDLSSLVKGLPVLLTTKLNKDNAFAHVFVTREFPSSTLLSNTSSTASYSFPLDGSSTNLFSSQQDIKVPGLETTKLQNLRNIGLKPEEVLNWIYAVLHSAEYRNRYFGLLQYDFPRIPENGSLELVESLSRLGSELVSLHLMESPKLDKPIINRVGSDDFIVDKVSYSDQTVWLDKNKKCGFQGVTNDVWNFRIGGWQVCEQWLKDRGPKGGKNASPGRLLTLEDINHYQRIIVAITETISIMKDIDVVIDKHGGWSKAFK
tara:strand:+ start:3442 stop:6738 length:3297 start_codon:yes stop_codon:yes gene_type:complete